MGIVLHVESGRLVGRLGLIRGTGIVVLLALVTMGQ